MDYTKFSGYDFEDYISKLLTSMGFVVEQTTYSNDGGIDIIAVYEKPIFSGKYIIQCKNWQGNVGAPEIRDLFGVVMDQRANKGILITPSDFTEQAYAFAKGKNIELINGRGLKELSKEFNNDNIEFNNSHNVFPKEFNVERYKYLENQIKENSRESKYYLEMKKFLLEYLNNEKYTNEYIFAVEAIIKTTDDLINKCYNTKTKRIWKKTELMEKAVYCLILGEIEEALELVLDNDRILKKSESLPFEMRPYLVISADYGKDCLTRNLYTFFSAIGYKNGIRIIDNCPRIHYRFNSGYIPLGHERDNIDIEIEKINRYINWNENLFIYIPSIYPIKDGKNYTHRVHINERYIEIEKIKKPEKNNELYERLDSIFRQHGFEIS